MKALALILLFASPMSGPALLRETPGVKTYNVHQLRVGKATLPDAGILLTTVAYTTATLELVDGGSSFIDLGGIACTLSPAQETTLLNLMTVAANCAKTAP